MDDLTAGMTVSAAAVASTSDTAKQLVGALAVARGEGRSKACEDDEAANRGDIQEAGPSTPKAAAGGVARGLAMLPRLATTLRSKGKGKGKAQKEEDKNIEDHIEEMFTDKCLATLLCWQKTSMVVDTGLGAGVKLEKAKGKVTVLLEKQQEYNATTAGPIMTQRAAGTPLGSSPVITATIRGKAARTADGSISKECEGFCGATEGVGKEGAVVGGGGGTKVKSREVVESNKDDNNSDGNVPLAQKQAASPASVASAKQPQTVASEEGEGDVEMRETTPLATVAEAEREASNMEEERAEEAKVWQRGTWSDTPLRQVGDDELEWLGEDLGWPTPLMSAALLVDFDKRVAGVERWFQRELEVARKELLAARAHYTVTKQTLATPAGYWRDCQAFLAWQEENNVGEGDWEEAEAMEVPDDDTDLDA
ncbi:hypothetical protein E4T56_gene12514 [Termitomyces sp. T112]|nr:hypothetical protein E4T56_gene12514 [Termitomyces sp. T112]